MRKIAVGLLVILLLAACSQQVIPTTDAEVSAQANTWEKLGGALDFTAAKSAIEPKLVLDKSGNLVVTWLEDGKIYLERWTGTAWQGITPGLPSASGAAPRRIFAGFNLVFDTTNSPVISTKTTNGVAVYRRNPQNNMWQQLGATFNGPAGALSTDKNGAVYSVLFANGKNVIRRWTGTTWQSVYTFQKTVFLPGPDVNVPIAVYALGFKSDGKPFVKFQYPGQPGEGESLSVWNGTSWDDRGSALVSADLDKQGQDLLLSVDLSQLFATNASLKPRQGNTDLSATNPPLVSNFPLLLATLTVDNLNRPIITTGKTGIGSNNNDLVIKRRTGGVWVTLGGVLDRVTTRNVTYPSVLVDGKGTAYAVWQECVAVANQTCTNYNIYVSKYVP
jgi:hypothetical protein